VDVYARTGEKEKFEILAQSELEVARAQLPTDSIQLAAFLCSLGESYLVAGRPDQAILLLREGLEIWSDNEPDGWQLADARSVLGGAILAQAILSPEAELPADIAIEVEGLLVTGLRELPDRIESVPQRKRSRVPLACERIIEFYQKQGQPAKVQEYQQRLESLSQPRQQN
jgi:tetratricopeptide (TPR) repeat protein